MHRYTLTRSFFLSFMPSLAHSRCSQAITHSLFLSALAFIALRALHTIGELLIFVSFLAVSAFKAIGGFQAFRAGHDFMFKLKKGSVWGQLILHLMAR